MSWSRNAPNANPKGRDPYGAFGSAAPASFTPSAASTTLASPVTAQFSTREQRLNATTYGAVSRLFDDENKTGRLGGSARRGAARSLLG